MKHLLYIVACLLMVSCLKNISKPDITTGLTVNIPLDGGAYDVVSNTTGVANHAYATANRHGEANKALYFTRIDSAYIDMGDLAGASFPDGKFTISCWVKVADTTNVISILSKRNAAGPFEYSLDNHFGLSSFKLDNWISNGGNTVYGIDPLHAAAMITPGTWQHIAFVADGNILKVYVKGSPNPQTDAKQTGNEFSDTEAHFVIGNGGGYGANNYFNGAIDDIRIYNRALDGETIQYLSQQ